MNHEPMLEITAYELAGYLAKNGQVEKASDLLRDLIVKNPKAATVRCVSALAQIAYEFKNWPDAESFWRVAANAEPSHSEAWIKLAHCLVELGRKADAEPCVSRARALLSTRPHDLAPPDFDAWLGGVREQVCLSFLGNRMAKGMDLLKMFSLPGTYEGGVVNGPNAAGIEAPLRDDVLVKLLDDANRAWEASERTVPYVQQRGDVFSSQAAGQSLAGKKVLLVLRRFFLSRADSRKHELGVFFETSARAAGLEPIFFPADPFLNPTAISPDEQYAELDRLGRTILSAKPDVVILDDPCNQESVGEYLAPEVYRNVFLALKEKHPFKLAGLFPDSWMTKSRSAMECAGSFLDVVWPLNYSPPADGCAIPGVKIFWAPIPYPDAVFRVGNAGKDISAGFVGSLFEYNSPRGIWLTLIKELGIPCQLFLSKHTTSGSSAGVTPEEYATFMSRLRISVNFSARATGEKIMTGRAWESIIAQSLLLEEDNDEIRRFFVPFVHYVPFKNISELQSYIRFFDRHEDARQAITNRAYAWFLRHYSKERIWHDLFSVAFA